MSIHFCLCVVSKRKVLLLLWMMASFLVDTWSWLYLVGIEGPECHRRPLILVGFSCECSPVWRYKVLAPVDEGIQNILHCVGWNPTIGINHKRWKVRLSLLQSAAHLFILSVSLLSVAASGLGFELPTCEKGFAIETCQLQDWSPF